MKIEEFITKFIDQDLPRFVQDLKICRTVRQIAAWKKSLVIHIESEVVEGEDAFKAYEELESVMGRLQTIQSNLGRIIDIDLGNQKLEENPEQVLPCPETRRVTEVEPNIAYSDDSVPELVTTKSKFQNIKAGFIGLLTNKKEELKQEISSKVSAPTQSLSN